MNVLLRGPGVFLILLSFGIRGEIGKLSAQGGRGEEGAVSLSLLTFENKSDYHYTVFYRERALDPMSRSVVMESVNWAPVLELNKGEKGEMEILLRDRDGFGVQVKIAPSCKDPSAQTFFIKGGIKSSGDCVQSWMEGPYAIILTGDEQSLDAAKDCQASHKIRYCAFKNSYIGVQITNTGIRFVDHHNASVLDRDEVSNAQLKEGKKP